MKTAAETFDEFNTQITYNEYSEDIYSRKLYLQIHVEVWVTCSHESAIPQ